MREKILEIIADFFEFCYYRSEAYNAGFAACLHPAAARQIFLYGEEKWLRFVSKTWKTWMTTH